MKFLVTLLLCTSFFMPTPHADEPCSDLEPLQKRVIQILREGRGVASGVLLDDKYALTALHAIREIEGPYIWVRTPFEPRHLIRATLKHSTYMADLALLELHPQRRERLPKLTPLTLTTVQPTMPVYHMGYGFGQLHRFDVIPGVFQGLQYTNGQKDQAMHVALTQPALGGDSGGPLFNCHGQLAGIEFANRAHEGRPNDAYFVSAMSIQNLIEDSVR